MFGFGKKRVYLDYASATPVLPEASTAVGEAEKTFGNPGSIHTEGVTAKRKLEQARESIAKELACKARELVFVSSGTEANNLAIVGFAKKLERIRRTLEGTHWIVFAMEHPSVLECFVEVERLGGEVTHLAPDGNGIVHLQSVEQALRPETIFISIGWANHEIGVVQKIADISRVIRASEERNKREIMFHCDAGQAPLYRAPRVHTLGVDMLSLDSGKLYGPRGIAALYLSHRVALAPVILGGSQERGLRAGTENVALAIGFEAAITAIALKRDRESHRLRKLRDDLAQKIVEIIPEAVINGDLRHALPHILNISIPHIDSEYIALALDKEGIAIATKSACREGEESQSHVVAALGGDEWRKENSLRFSLGRDTREKDLRVAVKALQQVSNTKHRTKNT